MLEELINLVREHAGSAVISNPAIPDQHNEAVVTEAGSSIMDSLKNMINSGQGQEVLNLFNHQGQGGNIGANPAVQNISGNFIQSLIGKFGLDPATAGNVANNLIPNVLQQLVHKTNDPGDNSFNLQGLIGHLTGGQGGGIESLIGSFTQGGAGGVMDKIKGLFGNA